MRPYIVILQFLGALDGPAGSTCLLRKYCETPKVFLVLDGLGVT